MQNVFSACRQETRLYVVDPCPFIRPITHPIARLPGSLRSTRQRIGHVGPARPSKRYIRALRYMSRVSASSGSRNSLRRRTSTSGSSRDSIACCSVCLFLIGRQTAGALGFMSLGRRSGEAPPTRPVEAFARTGDRQSSNHAGRRGEGMPSSAPPAAPTGTHHKSANSAVPLAGITMAELEDL